MCHKLDQRFFQELAAMAPEQVCRRALCSYDRGRECYVLDAWGTRYEAYPVPGELRPAASDAPPVNVEIGLSIIFYLLSAKDIPVKSEWISEMDLPGGTTFFRGPHAVPVRLITERFGQDLEGFKSACESLGGEPLELADAACSFRVLPRVPAAVLLWKGDDEFPARARVLFDRTVSQHLPMDVILGLCVELLSRIAG
jgi:hypothetical protein